MRLALLVLPLLLAGCYRVVPVAHGARTDPDAPPAFTGPESRAMEAAEAACEQFGAKVTAKDPDNHKLEAVTDAPPISIAIRYDSTGRVISKWVTFDVVISAPDSPWDDQKRYVR